MAARVQVILSSLPDAGCLCVNHNRKLRKVFIALEGLTRDQFEAWQPPMAQLRDIPSCSGILGVIVSCVGQCVLRHKRVWQYKLLILKAFLYQVCE